MIINGRYIRRIDLHWEKLQARSYLRQISCIANLKTLEFTKNITFFVGANGSGKSTLLRGIAEGYGFNPEGGSLNFRFGSSISDVDEDTGYYDYENYSTLADILTFVKGYRRAKPYASYYFRAESFYNVATAMLTFKDSNGCPLEYGNRGGMHDQSHGQSYESFMQHFKQPGLFILDEPESALSPRAQLALVKQIYALAQKDAQFIIATHSPILLAVPDCDIISFDGYELEHILYEDTESYRIYERLITDRENLITKVIKKD